MHIALRPVSIPRAADTTPGGLGNASQGVELDTRVLALSLLAAVKSACNSKHHQITAGTDSFWGRSACPLEAASAPHNLRLTCGYISMDITLAAWTQVHGDLPRSSLMITCQITCTKVLLLMGYLSEYLQSIQ